MHFAAAGETERAVSAQRLRRSEGEGCRTLPLHALDTALGAFPLIINTVPAMLLDARRLRLLQPKALVLDLASKPGGDDVGDRIAVNTEKAVTA